MESLLSPNGAFHRVTVEGRARWSDEASALMRSLSGVSQLRLAACGLTDNASALALMASTAPAAEWVEHRFLIKCKMNVVLLKCESGSQWKSDLLCCGY